MGERMSNNESVPFHFNSMIYGNWMGIMQYELHTPVQGINSGDYKCFVTTLTWNISLKQRKRTTINTMCDSDEGRTEVS